MCSINEDVQYESDTSSVQVRMWMCSTSKVDHQFWNRGILLKIVSNE